MLLAGLMSLLVAGLVNFYFSLQILRKVSAAANKISYFEIRWQVHRQLRTYCALMRAETGRRGLVFYGYWGTLLWMLLSVMLVFALALN